MDGTRGSVVRPDVSSRRPALTSRLLIVQKTPELKLTQSSSPWTMSPAARARHVPLPAAATPSTPDVFARSLARNTCRHPRGHLGDACFIEQIRASRPSLPVHSVVDITVESPASSASWR